MLVHANFKSTTCTLSDFAYAVDAAIAGADGVFINVPGSLDRAALAITVIEASYCSNSSCVSLVYTAVYAILSQAAKRAKTPQVVFISTSNAGKCRC